MKKEIRLALNLCEIPSISGQEKEVAVFLSDWLTKNGFIVEKIPVDADRFNIFAYFKAHARYTAILCTHLDTVAPFIAPKIDKEILWGRGSLDAKGILAAMVFGAIKEKEAGFDDVALLFTVGEEEFSDGAKACQSLTGRAKFLVVGEPTDLKAASMQKGSLVFDLLAVGREAHSSVPHLGDSAVHRLIKDINKLLFYPWGQDQFLGETLLNIGVISGGDMRNMLANQAKASGIMRITRPASAIKKELLAQLSPEVSLKVLSKSDPFTYFVPEGFSSFVVGFGSDAPHLRSIGQPILIGPGSIELAHKAEEHISFQDLYEGSLAYQKILKGVRSLQ